MEALSECFAQQNVWAVIERSASAGKQSGNTEARKLKNFKLMPSPLQNLN